MKSPFHSVNGASHRGLAVAALVLATVLAGCGPAPIPSDINDPDEARNRQVHDLNKALDSTFVSKGADAYGGVVPRPVRQSVSNLADTLDLPGDVANNLLQVRPAHAGQNLLRLAVNLTMGVGGLFDAATAIGIPPAPTDFGETLHVWGMPEGQYAELPLFGPTTDRDTLGLAVDMALNPARALLPAGKEGWSTAASLLSRLDDRDRFGDTVDSILYDSADSYAQARLLYLQNRRYELGQAAGGDAADAMAFDPYEDPYAE